MRKISHVLVTAVAALGVVGTGVGVAAADSPSVLACTIRVDVPNGNNDAYVGREGCSNAIAGEGFIYKHIPFWPDGQVGYVSAGDFGVYVAFGHCNDGNGDYYSRFESSTGASAESSRANRC